MMWQQTILQNLYRKQNIVFNKPPVARSGSFWSSQLSLSSVSVVSVLLSSAALGDLAFNILFC